MNLTALNFPSVANMFTVTGDSLQRAGMRDVEYLLAEGVKVTLVYGDQDYRCPWLGAEAVAEAAGWAGQERYKAAGYEEVMVNGSYVGGVVRQFGGLSFTRVFNAGHHGQSASFLKLIRKRLTPFSPNSCGLPARNRLPDLQAQRPQPRHRQRHPSHLPNQLQHYQPAV